MGTRAAEYKLVIDFKGTITNTMVDEQAATCPVGEKLQNEELEVGVSTDQASRLWEDRDRSLAAGGHHTLDLYDFTGEDIGAGAGNDALGQALVMQEITTFIVKVESGTGSLEIQPDPTNGWTPVGIHTVATLGALKLGGVLLKHRPDTDAFPVTDGASHQVRFKAVGAALTYSVYIAGRHDTDESSSSSTSSLSSSSSVSSSTSSSTSSFSSSSSSSVNSSSSSVNSSSSSSTNSSSSSTSSVNSSSSSTSSTSASSSSSS